jgi:hypothetical protein
MVNARLPVTENTAATVMGINSKTLINDAQKKSQITLKQLMNFSINKPLSHKLQT